MFVQLSTVYSPPQKDTCTMSSKPDRSSLSSYPMVLEEVRKGHQCKLIDCLLESRFTCFTRRREF